MSAIRVHTLGQVNYAVADRLQEKLQNLRIRGDVPDMLLLLEHPPTLTLAKGKDDQNIRVSGAILKQRGISVFPTDRGGSITCHGPGQIVGYPIIDLGAREKDIHLYIHNLESVIIRTLSAFSIEAGRDPHHVGVWIGAEKIAAIGVKIKKWVTKHGFALNVNSDLSYFDLINPCGITDRGVTSMKKRLGRAIDLQETMRILVEKFSEVFKMDVRVMDNADNHNLLVLNNQERGESYESSYIS